MIKEIAVFSMFALIFERLNDPFMVKISWCWVALAAIKLFMRVIDSYIENMDRKE